MEFLIDKVFSLKGVSVFEKLPEASLLDVARIMDYDEFKKGVEFIRKGEMAGEMYIVKSGEVKVHDGEHLLAKLGPGEIVGELALLTPIPRTASVSALSDVVVYKIGREHFLDLLYEKPELMNEIIEVLIQRIIALNEEIKKLKSGQ
ncbi:MAG: cyclic nucleotide-binding domain-containing protein [Saprospirales bacterium]|nr:MAG: cyclic nucleotide-binding domain-containing protein [Saprospirales bacterium]